jgi:hypothetical protein
MQMLVVLEEMITPPAAMRKGLFGGRKKKSTSSYWEISKRKATVPEAPSSHTCHMQLNIVQFSSQTHWAGPKKRK